jgi:hypothetical protein
VESIKKASGGLAIYHPRSESIVNLKAKMTKAIIDKFLKINLYESKKIPYNKLKQSDVYLRSCTLKKPKK